VSATIRGIKTAPRNYVITIIIIMIDKCYPVVHYYVNTRHHHSLTRREPLEINMMMLMMMTKMCLYLCFRRPKHQNREWNGREAGVAVGFYIKGVATIY
jgi:hypothetical protein